MDVGLPDMDGMEVTRLVRKWEKGGVCGQHCPRRIPIVALTAHTLDDAAER